MNITPATGGMPPAAPSTMKAMATHPAASAQVSGSGAEAPDTAPSIPKPKLQAPEKVNLGFDAKEMRQNLQEAIDRLNQQLKANGRDLSFQMDEEINRPIITVRNLQTGEVVRQIPTEEVVRMAHSIEDAKGLLFNDSL